MERNLGVNTDSKEPYAYGINSSAVEVFGALPNGCPANLGANYSQVDAPAETILIGDAALAQVMATVKVRRSATLDYQGPGRAHGRHGGFASLGWLDGHAQARRVDVIDRDGEDGAIPKSFFQQNKLGDILKYPREYAEASGPNAYSGSDRDGYYYRMQKS